MKPLFIVGAKILGVLFMYWVLIGLTGLITTIEHIDAMGTHILFAASFSIIVTFVFGLLLLANPIGVGILLFLKNCSPINTEELSFEVKDSVEVRA